MSVNINASTTNGLVLTSDTSGEIKLQANGADIATVDSSGITMAAGKTLPAAALTGSLPAGMGGKILQVVNSTTTSAATTTSSSFVTTSKSASITPSSASNKVLVLVHGHYDTTNGNAQSHCTIYRGATNLGNATYGLSSIFDGANRTISGMSMMYLDSPATTSSTTYTIYIKSGAGNTTVIGSQGVPTTITLLEVAG